MHALKDSAAGKKGERVLEGGQGTGVWHAGGRKDRGKGQEGQRERAGGTEGKGRRAAG